MKHLARLGTLALFVFVSGSVVYADGKTGARNTDAVIKEWADEFDEIGKKKPTMAGKERQLELIKKMEFGPCGTALRFLSDLLKSKKAPGDQRLYALRSLLRMADKKTFGKMLGVLSKAKDPTLWQVFGQELLVRPSGAIREWTKESGLKSRDPMMLTAVLQALARKPDAELAKPLAKLFAKHAKEKGNAEIAYHALKALVRLQPKVYIEQLAAATTHADWRVRLAAADVLPSFQPFAGDVEAATRTLIQDESPVVQQATIQGVGRYRRAAVGELLLAKLGDDVARTRHVAGQALQTIYTQKFGTDAKAWAEYLKKESPEKALEVETPKYHGIDVNSDNVVFVVDASSSMTWPERKETHRIDIALAELERTLGKLAPATQFNVMVFAEDQLSWKKTAQPATPENTAAAARWAQAAMKEPAGDTFFYEAIRAALEAHPGADTIFLLTDGNPTAGKYWSVEGLTASVRSWNHYRRTAINTVGLSLLAMDPGLPNLTENLGLMKRMMSAIASATSGEFREISNAPK